MIRTGIASHKNPTLSRSYHFVTSLTAYIAEDQHKGLVAALRRADNPATEYKSWEYLARFDVNLDKAAQRLAYCTIAAAIAKANLIKNGTLGLGKALRSCYKNDIKNEQAKIKLRRLLACNSAVELCRMLRPLLSFIAANSIPLDFGRLLTDILCFQGTNKLSIKARWSQDFYSFSLKSQVQMDRMPI